MSASTLESERKRILAVLAQAPALGIAAEIDRWIHALVRTKRRYPLLQAAAAELDRLQDVRDKELEPRFRDRIRNDAVLQLLRDSFDLLVIDLASIREGLTEGEGLLRKLAELPSVLRRLQPEDVTPPPGVIIGEGDRDEGAKILAAYQQQLIAGFNSEAFERLFPRAAAVVAEEDVNRLRNRFRNDILPIDQDRNHVRAHRFEYRPFDRLKHFVPLGHLGGQIEVIERMLVDLALVVTQRSWGANLPFQADEDRTAQDLADILVFGSINEAVNRLVPLPRTPSNPAPFYYARRKLYLEGRIGTETPFKHLPRSRVERLISWFRRTFTPRSRS